MKIEKFIVNAISQGQQHSAKKLTAQLRRKAYESGWSSAASRHLKVVPFDDRYHVTYPTEHASHIEDFEYGTTDTPPNPVVRQFLSGIRDTEALAYVVRAVRKAKVL